MSRLNCAVLMAVAFGVAGCGSKGSDYQPKPVKKIEPATLKPGEEHLVMPFVEGNQWTYDFEAQAVSPQGQRTNRRGTIVYSVASVKPNAAGDGKIATIHVKSEGGTEVGDVQVWEVNKKGLFQKSITKNNVPFEPMLPAIVFPAETGKTFNWSGNGFMGQGRTGKSTNKNTILGPQEVDTGEGRMSAIAVESETTYADPKQGRARSMVFFTPGIGIVRYRQSSDSPNGRLDQVLILKRKVVKTS